MIARKAYSEVYQKEAANHSRAAETSLVIGNEATNQYTESYEPIENKMQNYISNEMLPCVFFVAACLYHVITSHTRLIGAEDI